MVNSNHVHLMWDYLERPHTQIKMRLTCQSISGHSLSWIMLRMTLHDDLSAVIDRSAQLH